MGPQFLFFFFFNDGGLTIGFRSRLHGWQEFPAMEKKHGVKLLTE